MIRLAFNEYLRPQLTSPSPRQSAKQDLDFLAHFFTSERRTTYSVSSLSTVPGSRRHWSAFLEGQSGQETIAVERQELTEDDFRQAQTSLVSQGAMAKQGLHQVNRLELAAIVREAVMTKVRPALCLSVRHRNEFSCSATELKVRTRPLI